MSKKFVTVDDMYGNHGDRSRSYRNNKLFNDERNRSLVDDMYGNYKDRLRSRRNDNEKTSLVDDKKPRKLSSTNETPKIHKHLEIDNFKPKSSVVELISTEDYRKFVSENKKGVVFYGAEWCHACKDISDLYNRIAAKYGHLIGFAHADVDAAGLDFTHVPVFIGLKDGSPVSRVDGSNKDDLRELIKGVITSK